MSSLSEKNSKQELFILTKSEVIKHLEGISNQSVNVPIPGHKDISVKDLIPEVKKESEMGIRYMIEWLETIILITNVRKK